MQHHFNINGSDMHWILNNFSGKVFWKIKIESTSKLCSTNLSIKCLIIIYKAYLGRYHSIRATCVVKFWFFRKNHSGPFVHITWYHLIAKKRPKVPLPGAFSFWAFFPKNLQFCKICPDPHILGPTIKCYTISESSRLPRRRATLVIYLVASTNEK